MKVIFRFTVYNAKTNTVSESWTCLIKNYDVYLFSRTIGYALKFSLHTKTRQCHLKYTPKFANEKEFPNPYIDKWIYPKEGIGIPLTVIVPTEAVTQPYEEKSTKQIHLIPVSEAGRAIFIGLFLIPSEATVKGDSLFTFPLPGNISFAIAAASGVLPEINFPIDTRMKFYKGQSKETTSDTLRMLALANGGNSRRIFEFVGTYNDNSHVTFAQYEP